MFDGLLPDPRGEHTRFLNKHLKELQDFAASRALVLLGEPGAGKSTELDAEVERRREAGEWVAKIPLGTYLTAPEVQGAIRDARQSWKNDGASGDLTLAFDGFDEPLVAVSNLAHVLERELKRLDTERLRVLITSRRSVWPQQLSAAFSQLWPGGDTFSLVLAPLTEQNVTQAAATELGAPAAFMRSLRTAGVQSLAASPLPLRLLLAAHAEGTQASSRHRIYALGVEGLVTEDNTARVEQGLDDPPLPQRLSAAKRLAAASLLSGRSQVIRRSRPAQGASVLSLNEAADPGVGLDALQAVFDSAVFTDGREGRGWMHRSVQEFLAAEECEALPLASVQNLVADPFHPSRVLPQLAGMAAWLAEARGEVFDWLVEADPAVLMQADLRSLTGSQRTRVAGAVVAGLASGPVLGMRTGYGKLLHPGLAGQLAPLLAVGEPPWRQQEAMLIIQATGLRALDEQLMALLERIASGQGPEDYDEHTRVAEWAAMTLVRTRDLDVVERAAQMAADSGRPLAVRAALLSVLWPEHRDMRWLLQAVEEADRAPRSTIGRGCVTMLGQQAGMGRYTVEDLNAWAASFTHADHRDPAVQRLLGRAAWTAVLTGPVGSSGWRSGGKLLYAQLAANQSLAGVGAAEMAQLPPERRRQLVKDLLDQTGRPDEVLYRVHRAGWLPADDLQWWLDDLQGVDAGHVESAPAYFVLSALADAVDGQAASRVVAAAQASTPRWEILAERFAPAARAERARARQQLAPTDAEAWDAEAVLHEPQFAALVGGLQHRVDNRGSGPRPLPAWPALTEEQRHSVAGRALEFLDSDPDAGDEEAAELIGVACTMIEAVDASMLGRVAARSWLGWLPGLWDVPGGLAALTSAVKRAAAHDPYATTAFLIQKMSADAPSVAFHQRSLRSWQLSAHALAQIGAGGQADRTLSALLDIGAAALPDQAARTAFDLLQRHRPGGPGGDWLPERETAVVAGACLAACPMSAAEFDGLLEALEEHPDLGAEIIRRAHQNVSGAWTGLTAQQRGRLHLWGRGALPKRRPVAPGRVVRMDPVEEFASQILQPLLKQASQEAVEVLEELAEQTGDVWLRAAAVQTRDAVRAAAWRPPTIAQVLAILTDPSRRIVTSHEQLAVLLAETLDEIGDDLREDRGLRAQLWHRQRPANQWAGYVPAEEREVSTWLSRELRRRLKERAAVLREVEINPGLGKTTGDIPDLFAVSLTTEGEEVSVPAEVKCSWHKDIVNAVHDQLGTRYLQGLHGTAGVYIAVFFSGTAWNATDRRRAESARHASTLDNLRADLHSREVALAARGVTAHVCVLDASLEADQD
ncbi:NACHT domain-containing protein [Streptomyces sp. NPDC001848]|uniref:NACHT domain-containing protein n=1 Tax=Streptomyces sp. NPDC001848 TaxID=3364618 RepID=UPI0036D05A5C